MIWAIFALDLFYYWGEAGSLIKKLALILFFFLGLAADMALVWIPFREIVGSLLYFFALYCWEWALLSIFHLKRFSLKTIISIREWKLSPFQSLWKMISLAVESTSKNKVKWRVCVRKIVFILNLSVWN